MPYILIIMTSKRQVVMKYIIYIAKRAAKKSEGHSSWDFLPSLLCA